MSLISRIEATEISRREEEQELAAVSVATLRYMRDYGLACEERLVHHHSNLEFLADTEYDLLEAMLLNARLNSVTANVARTGRKNRRLEAELLKRTWEASENVR